MKSASRTSSSSHPVSFLIGSLFVVGALGYTAVAPTAQDLVSSNNTQLTLTSEQVELLSHLSIVYRDDGQGGLKKTIRASGIDFQVVNGLGATNGLPGSSEVFDPLLVITNGLGNLIIGYNEMEGAPQSDRTGSHNLVLGIDNNYSSFGGLVGSYSNLISAPFASISGGHANRASGLCSSVSGGNLNHASGKYASVTAGFNNLASGQLGSVTGGLNGWAYGAGSTVSGGFVNRADGYGATVSAGSANLASGQFSSVSGGGGNRATALYASVSGGGNRTASSTYNWVAGSLLQNY